VKKGNAFNPGGFFFVRKQKLSMNFFTLQSYKRSENLKKFFTILFFTCITACSLAQKSWAQTTTEEKIVKFYPNPAISYITFDIQRPVSTGYVIQIYNFLGRRVLAVSVSSNRVTVPLDNLFRGVYIFQLRDKEGNIIESNKFQINK
jgi:hypothetical protein